MSQPRRHFDPKSTRLFIRATNPCWPRRRERIPAENDFGDRRTLEQDEFRQPPAHVEAIDDLAEAVCAHEV